jgi:sarcosine oxidase subunit delta
MRLPCPFCGERDVSEFVCKGEVLPARPDPAAPGAEDRFVEYLYARDNPAGPCREHWYHAAGCRRWLLVTRDLRSHAVLGAAFVDGGAA